MRGFCAACVAAVWLGTASAASASAWNPAQWDGELISGYVVSTASEAVDEFGETVALDIYKKQIVQNYGNLGLTDRIALVGAFDWQDTQIIAPGLEAAFSKPSSVSAGLQYQLSRREGHATAISVSYIDGIDLPVQLLTLESRKPSIEARALWGESRSVFSRNAFAELQVAGRMELDGRYASSHAQLTLGMDPTARTKLLAKGRYARVEAGTFERIPIARQERWEVEASAVWRAWRQNYVELGYVGTVSVRNGVRESGYKIGYWTKF